MVGTGPMVGDTGVVVGAIGRATGGLIGVVVVTGGAVGMTCTVGGTTGAVVGNAVAVGPAVGSR